jgi:hypothetical protein
VFKGRCKAHAVWERARRTLRAPRHAGPIELHHVHGVEDNRPEAFELRCRKHNPRGAPTHER